MADHGEVNKPYNIEGALLESCSCMAPCPCWIGADPDGDSCQAFNAYHIVRGKIDGVDVAGCDFIRVLDIPGNVLVPESWREVFVVDVRSSEEQVAAILAAYTGALGGPLADLARLVRETLGVEYASISYDIVQGSGVLRAGRLVSVDITPFVGADGTVTTLRDSLMASAPRAPAYIARAEHHDVTLDRYGFKWAFKGRSAIHSEYRVTNDV
ncbi:MAG TPA: DUF1326 domain-containing protein [Solirubrobacteraceae bacterium]|jgi:hypothetical protein|nr:DUF1326 domain-containing protein [Solirubrobacteraceae bacterium]